MSDLPPEHRRWWSWWSVSSFAEDEWRELTLFADNLRRAERDIRCIIDGMGPGTAHTPIAGVASKLRRLGRRWERRADSAKADAILDHQGDLQWAEAQERRVNDDLAENLLARGLNALTDAEPYLDAETQMRIRLHRQALEQIHLEVYDRDRYRRLRRESD